MSANTTVIEGTFIPVINGSMATGADLPNAPKSVRGESRRSKAEQTAIKAAKTAFVNGNLEESKAIAAKLLADAKEKEKAAKDSAKDAAGLRDASKDAIELGKIEKAMLKALISANETVFSIGRMACIVSDGKLYKAIGCKTLQEWIQTRLLGYSERSIYDAMRLHTLGVAMGWDLTIEGRLPLGSLIQVARIRENGKDGKPNMENRDHITRIVAMAKTAKLKDIKAEVDKVLGKAPVVPATPDNSAASVEGSVGVGEDADGETVNAPTTVTINIVAPVAMFEAFCASIKIDPKSDDAVISHAFLSLMGHVIKSRAN